LNNNSQKRLPEISVRLEEMLDRLRLTGENLAEDAGVKPSTLSGWRKGRAAPQAEAIAAWVLKYNIDANWLLADIGEMQRPDEINNAMSKENLLLYRRLVIKQDEIDNLRHVLETLRNKIPEDFFIEIPAAHTLSVVAHSQEQKENNK
jgi:transcriptional regulator with XRE-family HTH domain